MAVLVSKSTTTTLSTANGYDVSYINNVVPFNEVDFNYVFNWAVPSFSTNHSIKSVIIPIRPRFDETQPFNDIQLTLLKSIGTVTFSTTGNLVNRTSHGFSTGDAIQFSSTGTMPVNAWSYNTGYIFYVRVNDANSFYIYRTYASSLVGGSTNLQTFTSAGTGTHTVWLGIGRKRIDASVLNPQSYNKRSPYIFTPEFVFDTPVAVTTTDTLRYNLTYVDGYGAGYFFVYLSTTISGTTAPVAHIALSTDEASYSDGNDFICVRSPLTIDINSFNPKEVAGVSTTTTYAGWLMNLSNRTFGNDVSLKWLGGVTAARDATGRIWGSSFCGVQIGEPNNEITLQYPFRINLRLLNQGSVYVYGESPTNNYVATTSGIIYGFVSATISSASPAVVNCARANLNNGDPFTFASNGTSIPAGFSFGKIYYVRNKSGNNFNISETPSGALLNNTGAASSTLYSGMVIKKSELDVDINLVEGDWVYIRGGSSNRSNTVYETRYYVSDVTSDAYGFGKYRSSDFAVGGTGVITLGPNYNIPVGSYIYTNKSHPISAKTPTQNPALCSFLAPIYSAHKYIKGVAMYNASNDNGLFGVGTPKLVDNDNQHTMHEIMDCLTVSSGAWYNSNNGLAPTKHSKITNIHALGMFTFYTVSKIITPTLSSGDFIVRDVYTSGNTLWCLQLNSGMEKTTFDVDGAVMDGSTYNFGLVGVNSIYKNIYVNNTSAGVALLYNVNNYFENIYINNTANGLNLTSGAIVFSSKGKNFYFGNVTSNTSDITFGANPLVDLVLDSNEINPNVNITNMETMSGQVKMPNNANTVNNDKVLNNYGYFQRTGDGLADTTVHTSGTGKFAIRFENTLNLPLTWSQVVPTQNIQGKTMNVYVWVKINNSAYWSGSHQKPKLTVRYDESSTVTATATETTDWQILSVPITPATTTGDITVTLSTQTDQTGSNAYVYFDDIGILYPAGHQLNLGSLDSWSNALPVTPSLATNVSAIDVWSVPTSELTGAGTIGRFITKLLTVAKFLGLK